MNFFNERKKDILIVALMIVIIELVGCILVGISNKDTTKKNEVILEKKEDVIEANEEVLEEYYVDIKGAVKKPGVYKLNKGSIVNDVIKMAGGLKSNASTKYINLSYEIKNHDVIYIYTNSEVKKAAIKEECVCPKVEISKCENSSIVTNNSITNNDLGIENETIIEDDKGVVSSLININTASIDELLTLNGIGESKALAIIEYRKINKFTKIEDLMNVSGIGEALYNKVKDSITV